MAKFDIGDKVKHKVFGDGTIVDIAVGTYACVWGIIGDYVYTYVTSYPRGEAYPLLLTFRSATKFI